MTTFNRWCLVALGVVLIIAVPVGVRALPVSDPDVSGADLLERVDAAADHPYSGYVQTRGTLQLPVADRFTDVGALFGEATRMRVWWRSAESWRVNRLLVSGERDLIHAGALTTEYDYEDAAATTSRDPDIRLPRASDLLPPVLGARVLSDADPGEVTRLPARRVAGIAAPGLRLVPDSPRSSIDHVDLWADPDSGVPLRVEVYADADSGPDFTTELREFSADAPARDRVSYEPTGGTDQSFDDVLDIADAANQYAPLLPPDEVGGLAKSSTSDGAVGIYGTGVTELIAIPLRDREADPLRDQVRATPGAVQAERGTTVAVGPLGVLLTGDDGDGGWLVAGTVTRDTLLAAGDDLANGTVLVGDR